MAAIRRVFDVVDADLRVVENDADGAIDQMIASVGNDTRLMVVLTPNNPTGLMLTRDELVRLRDEVPENVLLFIDEAYFEFAR